MSENLIPTSFKTLDEALNVSQQVRRASIVYQNTLSQWHLILINNRYKLQEDLKEIQILSNNVYIYLNDNYGEIKRKKIHLNSENVNYIAKILFDYNGIENYVSQNVPDITSKLKKMLIPIADQKDNVTEDKNNNSRNGNFKIKPIEFFCYYKRFIPTTLNVEQKVNEECYETFYLFLTISDIKGYEAIEPSLRIAKKDKKQVLEHIQKNGVVELRYRLNERILERLKFHMFKEVDLNTLFQMKSPLKRFIFTDLNNYDLFDFILL